MNSSGHALPGTPIAINLWNLNLFPEARIFFLSYFHEDHIVGLTSTWEYPIYASPVTCEFLLRKLRITPSLVKRLEIGRYHLIPLDLERQEFFKVVLFHSNHSPGSVMFLFSGYFGNILYTSEFRYKENIFYDFELPPIDVLYLDNTYCSPKCIFPSRENAISKIISQLLTCLSTNDRVYLGLDNLGKIDIILQIVRETRKRVCVKSPLQKLIEIMELTHFMTTDESNTNIIVVPANQISEKNIRLMNQNVKTHAIIATARYCGYHFQPFKTVPEIHVIPYSTHPSFTELKKFVKLVKPCSIVPIIGKPVKGIHGINVSERADMSIFKEFLSDAIRPEIVIPETVKRAINISKASTAFMLPLKKRKNARKMQRSWHQPRKTVIQCSASEGSETDSDSDAGQSDSTNDSEPYALNFFPKNVPFHPNETDELSGSAYDSEHSDTWYEVKYGRGIYRVH